MFNIARQPAFVQTLPQDPIYLLYKLILVLLLPLVIIAWQYSWRTVSIYSLGLFLLQTVTAYLVLGPAAYAQSNIWSLRIYELITFLIIGYVISRGYVWSLLMMGLALPWRRTPPPVTLLCKGYANMSS